VSENKPQAKRAKSGSTASVLALPSLLTWKPHYAMSQWVNHQLHDMVTVVVSLTGGVDIEEECKVFVSDNNNDLVVQERMIKMLTDVDLMHSHWNRKNPNAYPPTNPKIMGFHKFFSTIRKREDDELFTTAIIPLPFPVQTTIVDMHKLGNDKGARLLYVDLKAMACSEYKSAPKNELIFID
jgi:hypothetical protein